MNDNAEKPSPEMLALANWTPPEPVFLPPPDLDATLDGIKVQPWLLASVRCYAQPEPSQPGCLPVACATAIGRLARLWSPWDRAQVAPLTATLLDGRDSISLRCATWGRSLSAAQLGFLLRCGLNHVDDLYASLAGVLRGEDGIASLAKRRDDLESLWWLLHYAWAEGSDMLQRSLERFDEYAKEQRTAIEALGWPDDELLRAVACNEPAQWWGHIEGVGHAWGMDDLLRDEEG